ncbi:UNVERIFIED_CONTAM: hypothetical protein Scaly_1166400 [Sesamum calycinum]|uniref:Uncharacterized protein n=1 Tax=Sesamum calycinum TaxID=2727403 RepID=A0AAW2Q2X7_9LAMI
MVVACARSHVGFMQTFNHAMLAKQLWRITSNLNALLSRLLKQKYFPHSDVFQASAGTGCSFTWHSILTARDLFIPGLRWHIRTGQNVCIWKDRWIPRPWKFQVITAPNTLHPDATVDKLLDDSGGWNEALIQSVFRPEDTGLILGIGRTSIDQALLELFPFVGLSRVLTSGYSSRTTEFQRRNSSNGFGDWNILSLALDGKEQLRWNGIPVKILDSTINEPTEGKYDTHERNYNVLMTTYSTKRITNEDWGLKVLHLDDEFGVLWEGLVWTFLVAIWDGQPPVHSIAFSMYMSFELKAKDTDKMSNGLTQFEFSALTFNQGYFTKRQDDRHFIGSDPPRRPISGRRRGRPKVQAKRATTSSPSQGGDLAVATQSRRRRSSGRPSLPRSMAQASAGKQSPRSMARRRREGGGAGGSGGGDRCGR